MIGVVLTLVVIGVLLYLLDSYVPMDARIKQLIYVVVIICVIFWLINVFGLLNYDVPIPRLRGK
jgi:hypothetical protein